MVDNNRKFRLKPVIIGNNPIVTRSIPEPSAVLQFDDTNGGFLLPRYTTAVRDSVVNPANGLMIFNIDTQQVNVFNSGGLGAWAPISGGGGGAIIPATSISPAPIDNFGAVGISTLYAREDHMHPESGVSAVSNNNLIVGSDGLHFSPDEVISSAIDLVGIAPTGAQYGINTTAGTGFYVSGGNWSPFASGAGATNLTYNSATNFLMSDTGTDVTLPVVIPNGIDGLMIGADKAKLDGIAIGANVNVNSDWNAVLGDALILNKPATVNDLVTGGVTDNLSAQQGVVLKAMISGLGSIIVTPSIITRDTLTGLSVGDIVHVIDDGVPAGFWRRYQMITVTTGAFATATKVIIAQQADLGGSLVVSADLNNDIISGTDSGAFLQLSAAGLTAADIANVPAGAIISTNVQAAINELQVNLLAAGITNLTYTAPTRTISSSTGTNAILPLAGTTDAGLLIPSPAIDAGKIVVVAPAGGYETRDSALIPETIGVLVGTNIVITAASGGIQTLNTTANTVITPSLSNGSYITVMVSNIGAFIVTWAPTIKWAGGSVPILGTTGYNTVIMWQVAGTVYASYLGEHI